jgi:phosphoribosylanthranilate isomerase
MFDRPPRIKVCGLRDVATAVQVAEAGADAIGLVFYPPSPRHVSVQMAADIAAALPPFVTTVALFVDAAPADIEAVLKAVPIDLLQFHGDETPEDCRRYGRPYLKAIRVRPGVNLLECADAYHDARALLCDAYSPAVPGGTGERFDWALLPARLGKPLVLSGGLDARNVGAAIAAARPWAVDVSSGVERTRGEKDPARVAEFVQAVRAARPAKRES